MQSAASFALGTTSTAKVVKAFVAATEKVQRPAVALVFVSGGLAGELPDLVRALKTVAPGVPFLLAVGAGVLNEHTEIEAQSGASGIVFTDADAQALALEPKHGDLGSALGRALGENDATTALVLVRPDRMEPGTLAGLSLGQRRIFGGGTGADDIYAVDGRGRVTRAPMATLVTSALKPLVATTRACRLISPLCPVTRYSGNMLLELDGERALDVLSMAGGELAGQPLIFVALSSATAARRESSRGPDVQLRPIQGVDPTRRGIVLGEELQPDTFAAFAVRDRVVARADMEAMARELARESAGALPRFAIYVNCAGRGSGLYESANVDTRILRSRFGELPIVGFQSTFELAPSEDHLALHVYSGVLALFTSPS